MKIVILERHSVGTDIDITCLNHFGNVISYNNTVGEETANRVTDADIIICNKAPMNESTLKDAKNVRLICLFATGYDNVDTDYCKSRGITVCNVSDYCTDAVAQHTFAMTLFLLEKLHHYDRYVKSGQYGAQKRFSNFDLPYYELANKTWGIVGMGHIGHRVARIASAFGCKVIFYSASGHSHCTDYERVSLETLLKSSDIISLHCPLSDKTFHLIDDRALHMVRPSSILINVARGPVVDNTALYHALNENRLMAAGLDVLEGEPITPDNPLSQFTDSTRLIITPHMAWASTEARQRVVDETAENIKAFLKGEPRNTL